MAVSRRFLSPQLEMVKENLCPIVGKGRKAATKSATPKKSFSAQCFKGQKEEKADRSFRPWEEVRVGAFRQSDGRTGDANSYISKVALEEKTRRHTSPKHEEALSAFSKGKHSVPYTPILTKKLLAKLPPHLLKTKIEDSGNAASSKGQEAVKSSARDQQKAKIFTKKTEIDSLTKEKIHNTTTTNAGKTSDHSTSKAKVKPRDSRFGDFSPEKRLKTEFAPVSREASLAAKLQASDVIIKKRGLQPNTPHLVKSSTEAKETHMEHGFSAKLLEAEINYDRLPTTLAFYKKLLAVLMKIYKYMSAKESFSSLIQIFLEQSKHAHEIDELFTRPDAKPSASILLHTKLTLVFVLFILNYVNIDRHSAKVFKVFDGCLQGFCTILTWLRQLAKADISKAHAINELLIEMAAFTGEAVGGGSTLSQCVKALRAIDLSMKQTVLSLVQSLYQSSEIIWQVETLFTEFDRLDTLCSFQKVFEVFEEMTRSSCEEVSIRGREESMCDADLSEHSFYCDNEDPNFILQPLKAEKYLGERSPTAPPLTLVLDLDETLVHFEESEDGGEFLVRPFASEFIQRMAEMYEIIVFTAAVKDYADWIIDRIDPDNHITARLYRNHTYFQNGTYIKDLSRLGRDLSRVVIVDNNIDNFQLQPENGIYIKTWLNDANDVALAQLGKLLTLVASRSFTDVRVLLTELQEKMERRRVRDS